MHTAKKGWHYTHPSGGHRRNRLTGPRAANGVAVEAHGRRLNRARLYARAERRNPTEHTL